MGEDPDNGVRSMLFGFFTSGASWQAAEQRPLLVFADFVHRSPMKILLCYIRLAPTQLSYSRCARKLLVRRSLRYKTSYASLPDSRLRSLPSCSSFALPPLGRPFSGG